MDWSQAWNPSSHLPDLVPCNFFMLQKVKQALKGTRFDTMKAMICEDGD